MKTQKRASSPAGGFKRIMVALDFSEPSRSALTRAVEVAQTYSARLCLVHVVDPPPFISGAHTDPLMLSSDKLQMLAQTKLYGIADTQVPDVIESESRVVKGRSHKEIVKLAQRWRADLIVLATHGHTGLKHAFLGSTAESVVRYAPCAVLVIRN
jgi:nucleotide-binding universal stress UspA family protein